MKVIPLLSVVAFLTVAGCASNNSTPLSSAQRAQVAQIDTALKLAAERRYTEAEGIIQPDIHAKHFDRLPSAEQYRALLSAAKLAFDLKQPKLVGVHERGSRGRAGNLPGCVVAELLRLGCPNESTDAHWGLPNYLNIRVIRLLTT